MLKPDYKLQISPQAVADPGFPDGGGGEANLLFRHFFLETHRNIKKLYVRVDIGSKDN